MAARWAAAHFAGLSRRVSGHDSDEPAAHDCRQDAGTVCCDGYNALAFALVLDRNREPGMEANAIADQ
jgi:hypothetical protein